MSNIEMMISKYDSEQSLDILKTVNVGENVEVINTKETWHLVTDQNKQRINLK